MATTQNKRFQVTRTIGQKRYEFCDHLSNVRNVITDTRKSDRTGTSNPNFVFHRFATEDVGLYNMYAYGMPKTEPNDYINASGFAYRYGFNGQEKVDEIAGVGNHNTVSSFGREEYDTRLGRRWNLDPVDQVNISNYACFYNNPISIADIMGDKGEKPKQPGDSKYNNPRWVDPNVKTSTTPNSPMPDYRTGLSTFNVFDKTSDPSVLFSAHIMALGNLSCKASAKHSVNTTFKRKIWTQKRNICSEDDDYVTQDIDAPTDGTEDINNVLNDFDVFGLAGGGGNSASCLFAKSGFASPVAIKMIINRIAINKHLSKYTPLFNDVLKSYLLLTLKQAWNLISISSLHHYGRHPNLYHDFIFDGIKKAHQMAKGNSTEFKKYFKLYVTDELIKSPSMLHK
jgi:hypothetical protein